jgi:urease accessory protein
VRAAYHLGNRHVALEIRPGELRLLEDAVLAALLERLGLPLERRREPFLPEAGAYDSHHHLRDPGAGEAPAAEGPR